MEKKYPTLKKFFDIVYKAESDDPKTRNIYNLFEVLKLALKINSRLLGHFITRTTALTSFDWSIQGNDSAMIDKVTNRVKSTIDYIISNHANTPFYGGSLYKLGIDNSDEGTKVRIEKKFKPEEFDYDLKGIHFYDKGQYNSSIDIDEELYLLDSFLEDLKGGLLRSIMITEILRFDMSIENANFLKKLKGILQIKNSGGAGTESEKAAQAAASNAVANNFFISDDQIELILNEITGNSGSNFDSFIERCNKDISIAILGQANTTELPNSGGSRAALQVMQLISKDIFFSDMVRIQNLIDRYLLIDYRYNTDNKAVKCPYNFTFNIEEEEDTEKNAAVLQAANKIVPLSKKETYAKLGLTVPQPGEEVIEVSKGSIF